MTDDDRRAAGMALVQRLFAGVETGVRLPKKLADYTVEHVFGDVWQGNELALEERSLVTCTLLVALNREGEQRLHFAAARNLGIPRRKLEGVIIQAAHYAGWPSAVGASRVLDEVWPQDG